LAVWAIGEHERDFHGPRWAKVNGVDVAASLAAYLVVMTGPLWLRGKNVMAFELIARRTNHGVVEDLFLLLEEVNLFVHVPGLSPRGFNPSDGG
tara:strand:- start:939 stop:1220 length:282 start_codon:yes stop_codon:yes gene_type:complete